MPYKDLQARREWYNRNKGRNIASALNRNKQLRQRNIRILEEAKDTPCTDCKVKYPRYVMQFDHVSSDKIASLSVMAWIPSSEEKLRLEMAKCEIVCANCHATRTYNRSVPSKLRDWVRTPTR